MKNLFLILYFGIILITNSYSQNIESIIKTKSFKFSGFISTNQVLNFQPVLLNANDTSESAQKRKDPYTAFYTGGVNFEYRGINIPFTFVYSKQRTNFAHPFNQYALHPEYKWIKLHIGSFGLQFSPYIYNGIVMTGAGVELSPKKVYKFSAIYGQLQKKVLSDTSLSNNKPAFKRMGYAMRAGIEKDQDNAYITFLKAKDINDYLGFIDSTKILPQENTALSFQGSKLVLKGVIIKAEYARTAYTTDIHSTMVAEGGMKPENWFMKQKSSTIHRSAVKANLNYNNQYFSAGLGYEKVDPEYRTMGAYYFNNNFENFTINFAFNILKSKLNISTSNGLQKDNLNKTNMTDNKRIVSAYNINYTPIQKINVNASYSDFSSYTNVRSSFDYINQTSPLETYDTLNYRQISKNIVLGMSYQIQSGKIKSQSLSLNLN